MEKTDLDRKGIPAENEAGAEGLSPCGCAADDPSEGAEDRENGRNSDAADAACCCRTKARSEKEQRDLINRLSRIEGQIRGLKGMIERDAYCTDILTQVAAANAALNGFTKVLLASHIKTCVAQDIRDGKDETIDELVATLQKLMK